MNVTVLLMGNLRESIARAAAPEPRPDAAAAAAAPEPGPEAVTAAMTPGARPGAIIVDLPPGTSVNELMHLLGAQNPDFRALAFADERFSGAFQVLIGDRHLSLVGGWERVLQEGDLITLVPPFAGG